LQVILAIVRDLEGTRVHLLDQIIIVALFGILAYQERTEVEDILRDHKAF
jgi:hypothetical protein